MVIMGQTSFFRLDTLAALRVGLGGGSLEALSNWLTLVPVLALEEGSALAGLLMAQGRVPSVAHVDGLSRSRLLVPHGPKSPRDKVSEAIVSRLMSKGEVLGGGGIASWRSNWAQIATS